MKKIFTLLSISCLILSGCTKTNINTSSQNSAAENTMVNQETSDQVSSPTNTMKVETNSEDTVSILQRDSQRLSDIGKIRAALELFEADNKTFPKSITPGQPLVSLNGSVTYMAKIPNNPTPWTDGGCSNKDYEYSYDATAKDYLITFCLGAGLSNYDKGSNTATSTEVKMTRITANKTEENIWTEELTSSSPTPAPNNYRDQKRFADIKQMAGALELYYNDQNKYPEEVTPGEAIKSPDGATMYMAMVPSNPKPHTDKGCPDKDYIYTSKSSSDYNIQFCFGMAVGEIKAGSHIASPAGIK